MKPFSLDTEEASIVLVGSLNPAIFHPEWLLRNDLITQDDLKGANTEIVHRDLSKFSLDWLTIDVTRDKFIARTNDPSKFSPLKDLMISVLKILEHLPIDKMGMNVTRDYKIDDETLWHKVGDNLAPKAFWNDLPQRVGLTSMNVNSPRDDDLKGEINVGVVSIIKDYKGVRFTFNSHIELKYTENEKEIVQDAASIILKHWENTLSFAIKTCDNILGKALQL
jgi:hypothetical protein